MSFASELKNVLDKMEMKQKELSERTGLGTSIINAYMKGRTVPPKEKKELIARSLGLPEDYFLNVHVEIKSKGKGSIDRISVADTAKIMGLSVPTIQAGLQQGVFEWGYAIKTSDQWTYCINAKKLAEIERIELELVAD